ncbi:MAG: MMPL family transporter [Calditrichaeota bacterium]|nr:MMPL family transporter [Calditrichota bacterium]
MLKIANFVIRHRLVVILVILVITILLGWQALRVGLNADFSSYLREDDPLVQQYNRIGKVFGGNSIGIALITADDVFSKPSFELIKKLTDAYGNMEGISYATSLTNVVDFRKTEWGLQVGALLDKSKIPETPPEFSSLKSYVMSKDRYVGTLVSQDAKATAIILRFGDTGNKTISHFTTSLKVKQVTDSIIGPGQLSKEKMKIYFGGMPFLIFNMTMLITHNLEVLVPLMVLILMLILYIGFRSWAGVVFPLLVVTITVTWVVGLMGIFNLQFDLLTGIMPVVLLALGSADGIHLLKRYFERRRKGESARDAAHLVYKEMGTPIALTTITTMVGFSSLAISDFTVIRQFGLLTALGVLLALVITLTLLPALLSYNIRVKPGKTKKSSHSTIMDHLALFIVHRKIGILLASLVVVIVSLAAIPRIVKDVDWSLCLAKGSSAYHAEMILRNEFGGSLPIQILINGDLKDPAVLKTMRVIERKLETIPMVSKSTSVASVIAEMNAAMNDRYVIPETRRGVANLWFLIGDKDMMKQMVAEDDKEALLQARLDTWRTTALVAAVDSINTFLTGLPSELAVVDLSTAPQSLLPALLQIRKQTLMKNLRRDMEKYGLSPSTDELRQVVASAMNARPDKPALQDIGRAVTRYLQSPEAELALPAFSVRRITRAVISRLQQGEIPKKDALTQIIVRQAPGADPADTGMLAESLVQVVRVAAGESRISPALEIIKNRFKGSLAEKKNLLRDVKGSLWEVNENDLVMGAQQAKRLFAGEKTGSYREVSWRFAQTGLAPVLNRMEEELTPTQTESLLITLIVIIVLLSLIFRSPLGGVLAVVPITITILVNFAVMGYTGIGLDSFTAMIASIAIGLGIDYAIHFISRFRDELKKDGNEVAALQRTLGTTGISILINTLSVGLGFSVLLAAGGQHIRRFGGLTALTMIVSAIFTLMLLPSLFLWVRPKFMRQAIQHSEETKTKKI